MQKNSNIQGKQHVDKLLLGGTAITVDPKRRVIRDAGIAIRDDRIAFVGKAIEASSMYEGKLTLNCDDKVLMPGLVNAHMHYSHHIDKGLIPDNLGPVVQSNFVHGKVSPYISKEDELWGTKAMLLEMIKSGTTSFLEAGSFYPEENIQGEIQNFGIKGMMGRRAFDTVSLGAPAKQMETADDIMKFYERFLKEFNTKNLRIRPLVTIVGMGRFTDKLAVESKKIADKYGVPLKMHLCNYGDQVRESRGRTGYRPVELLEKLGILDENTILVHMGAVTWEDIDIVAKHGTKVVWCPSATLKVGHGLSTSHYPEMLYAGIPLALGTDGSDLSNYHDMVRVMNLAACLHKGVRCDPEIMGAEQAIEMATINGAKTMGMEDEIGSIESGKKADIVIFDATRPEWRPLYNEIQTLVYSATGDSVEKVIIDGRIVFDNGEYLTADEQGIMAGLMQREQSLKSRLDMQTMMVSPWKFI